MIRVLICDDQSVVCEGLRAILSTVPEIQVIGVANDGEEAVELAETLHPDLVLMDLKMPILNGIQATRQIREKHPEIKVLVLTTYDFDEWVMDAIRAGASGYLLKDTPRDALVSAIQGTIEGKTYVDPAVAGKLFQKVSQSPGTPDRNISQMLSERELAVLRLIAQGLSNPEIAGRLYLSEGTVRNYVSTILDKLGVADRTQAAVLAIRSGLAGPGV